MKREKIKHSIIKYLEGRTQFVFGGTLARAIHEVTSAKESIVERRARELAEAGILEKTYEQVEGKGPRVVLYKINQNGSAWDIHRQMVQDINKDSKAPISHPRASELPKNWGMIRGENGKLFKF